MVTRKKKKMARQMVRVADNSKNKNTCTVKQVNISCNLRLAKMTALKVTGRINPSIFLKS